MIETSLRPYFVKMTCGHFEIRLMREATARQRWNSTATVESQAKCALCRGEAIPHVAPDHLHGRDTMCVLDADTARCVVCNVTFGDPCPTCRGRGFHFPGCDAMCPKTWNGFHCGKEAGHKEGHSFEPRCEGGA